MYLQDVIANFVVATIIVLSAGAAIYAFVEIEPERTRNWLARYRPIVRQFIDDCLALVGAALPNKPQTAALGMFASTLETDVEAVNGRPSPALSSEPGSERRQDKRYRTGFMGTLNPEAEAPTANLCDILDMSASGARIRPVDPMPPASHMTLGLERVGQFPASVVWSRGGEVGLRFENSPMQIAYMMRGMLPEQSHAH